MPFESLIETKNSTSYDLGFPGSLFCCSNTPLGFLLLSQTQTSYKQKTHPNPFSQRIGFEYELYGGELGTRTPDPLRVMHDGFSFFRTMIRQIEAICYRSATNGNFRFFLWYSYSSAFHRNQSQFFYFLHQTQSIPSETSDCFPWFQQSLYEVRYL